MIRKLLNYNGTMVHFGKGTVRIKNNILQNRYGAQVELATCEQTQIGKNPKKTDQNNRVILDFTNVESLNVFIEKLTDLREDLVNRVDSELPKDLRKLAIEYVKEKTGMSRPHKSQAPLIQAFEDCYKILVQKNLIRKGNDNE